MKWINVSMMTSRLAFANRSLARQIKTNASGRVKAPSIHPKLNVGSNSLDISNINAITAQSAWIVSIMNWGN